MSGSILFKENNIAHVVDYKTGAYKSGDVATIKAKNITGGKYFRQLVFYKILYENYRASTITVDRGFIDYVEPKSNGSFDLIEIKFSVTNVY